MPAKNCTGKILKNKPLNEDIYLMKVACDTIPSAGQFYMLRGWDSVAPLLGRPISVHDCKDGAVEFLYQVRGTGTELLANLREGDEVMLNGPLGNGFPLSKIHGKVAIATGGIGIAPMVGTARALTGCTVDFFSGFRHESYAMDALEGVRETGVATEDGHEGIKGFVTALFDPSDYDVVLTCGPNPMMEAIGRDCIAKGVPCYVSLESHMACGVGACLGCTIETKSGAARVCKDGPVFLAAEVYQ